MRLTFTKNIFAARSKRRSSRFFPLAKEDGRNASKGVFRVFTVSQGRFVLPTIKTPDVFLRKGKGALKRRSSRFYLRVKDFLRRTVKKLAVYFYRLQRKFMARTFKEVPRAVCPCSAPEMFLQRPKTPVAPLPPETDPSMTDKKRLESPWSPRGKKPPALTARPYGKGGKAIRKFPRL